MDMKGKRAHLRPQDRRHAAAPRDRPGRIPQTANLCRRSQTNDPAMQAACQPATDSAIIVSGCSRPECGCQDRIAGSAGGSPGSRHCPSWVPWQLGPWWRSGRELCQPQTTWSSQQEAPWPSKPVLEPVLSQTAVLSRVRHKPTRLPSLVGKMSLGHNEPGVSHAEGCPAGG